MDKKTLRALLRVTAAKKHNKPELMYTKNAMSMVKQYGVNNVRLEITENGYFAPACYVTGKLPDKYVQDFVLAWQYLHTKTLSLDQPESTGGPPLKDMI